MYERSLYEEILKPLQHKNVVILSESIIGTADASKIAALLNDFCKQNLGSEIKKCLLIAFSNGASFGLQLKNDQNIFLKINKPTANDSIAQFSLESAKAISFVQDCLYESGFSCPKVILPPIEWGQVIITVNSFEDIGTEKDAHNPLIRKIIAEKFAELIKNTSPYISVNGFKYFNFYDSDKLYPTPHSVLFDFTVTEKAGNWIDAIAIKSKKIINSIDRRNLVLGHSDWSLKHFRFIDNKIIMIYDWDSLCIQDEYHLLGIAASTFTTTWDIPVKITPSQEEAFAFVKEYEYVRQKKFTKEELLKISACATYLMAYTARCELCGDPLNKRFENSFRQALSNMVGDNYLGI